ncbi:hypothetical protein LB505_010331 [Fusarium chuoi]|nr:hypothetical protein LB505_010331 [Fusarium chuoi]
MANTATAIATATADERPSFTEFLKQTKQKVAGTPCEGPDCATPQRRGRKSRGSVGMSSELKLHPRNLASLLLQLRKQSCAGPRLDGPRSSIANAKQNIRSNSSSTSLTSVNLSP